MAGVLTATRGMSDPHADRLVGLVAAEQHGTVTVAQLFALGLGRGAVAGRVRRGLLVRLHRGVYLWGATTPSALARAQGALLACGDGAAISRHEAAALWELRPPVEGPIDVTAPGRRLRHPGIRTHMFALDSSDVRRLHGIAVTSPARTLLDLAPLLSSRALAAAVEQAQVRRLVTRAQLAATLARAPGRPGAPALRALVDEPAFTRLAAERRLLALLRAAQVAPAELNARAAGFEVDALWRAERVVLEFDSHAFHATRTAFERDRRRDAALTRAGYAVLRTTWRELTEEPLALVARVAEALARGPRR